MNGFSLEDLRSLRVEALRSEPLVVESTASISELIGALKRHNAYEVFIHDRRKISMITTREILKASDISRMKVSTLMFPPPKLSPNDSVGRAAMLMTNYRLRSLPIMERATFEGVITAQSLCKSLIKVKAVKNFRVSAIMSRKLITINKDDSVSKASNKMIK